MDGFELNWALLNQWFEDPNNIPYTGLDNNNNNNNNTTTTTNTNNDWDHYQLLPFDGPNLFNQADPRLALEFPNYESPGTFYSSPGPASAEALHQPPVATPAPAPVPAPAPAKRQRHASEESSDGTLVVRPRKTRKLKAPLETARVRVKGACFLCKKKRKPCQDGDEANGPCKRCESHPDTITLIPGLVRPVCWRPNVGSTEVFRRGPTLDFAASRRGNSVDAAPGKQALWRQFAVRRSGSDSSRVVDLSQYGMGSTLSIRLDKYKPKEYDKQSYTWYEQGRERYYHTPAFGIANLGMATSAIEAFQRQNAERYIEAHLRSATEMTCRTFQAAQQHKSLPLVERALKLWVACRFIEEPWSIVGSETLGMTTDPNPACPYYDRVPVPPIVDLQIDLIVVSEILQPELKKILRLLKEKLESSAPWNDWFEIYLAYFILLHNVELTMAHDAWFVQRYNLKKKYSNRALIDTISQGATTLLTCFHYAHQGFAPFFNPDLEHSQSFSAEQRDFLRGTRPLLGSLTGAHVSDPAQELFWTSQLHRQHWRPIELTG